MNPLNKADGITRTFHMCVSIEGVLRWPDKELVKLFDNKSGKYVRDYLKLELLKGRKVLPIGEPCEGFDYVNGCQGHEETESK